MIQQASGVGSCAECTHSLLRSSLSIRSDPMLSYITDSLVSARQTSTASSQDLHPEIQRWLVQWEDITPIRAIGRGSFGRVYVALWNETRVACKVLMTEDAAFNQGPLELPDAAMKELQKEAAMMAHMRHPNIVAFLGLCTLPPCIVTGGCGSTYTQHARCMHLTRVVCRVAEHCGRGSLHDVLRSATVDPSKAAELTWPLRVSMVRCASLLLPPMVLNMSSHGASHGACRLWTLQLVCCTCIAIARPSCTGTSSHQICWSMSTTASRCVRVCGRAGDRTVTYKAVLHMQVCDFNLSKLIEEAMPSAASTAGGANNPIWLVSNRL